MALQVSNEFKEIAEKLIDKYPNAFGHIELDKVLILSETEKSPKKYADIRRIGFPYSFLTAYKFIIIIYEPKLLGLTDAQKIMVCYHELLHIDSDFDKLLKHNIEDFRELISKYGVNWEIDPNLPNILEDDDTTPVTVVADTEEDEEEEPGV
jgi:predicted metallopeptidase